MVATLRRPPATRADWLGGRFAPDGILVHEDYGGPVFTCPNCREGSDRALIVHDGVCLVAVAECGSCGHAWIPQQEGAR